MDRVDVSDLAGQPIPILHRSKTAERWSKAWSDIREGFCRWQLWWLLGVNDIRQRYRRSFIGQLWITLSMGTFIGAIGLVYSLLFKMDLREYVPHLAVNFVVWTYIAGSITDACGAFTEAEGYLRQERLPKTAFLLRTLLRNLLIFAHNAILIPIVMVLFGISVSWTILLAVAGLALLTINLLLGSFFLGVICTRFRDMLQIVTAVLQIAFFISPVLWKKDQIIQAFPLILDFNPFAHHLIIISEPVLGVVPSLDRYIVCLATTVVLALVALPFFARYRERVVYWI